MERVSAPSENNNNNTNNHNVHTSSANHTNNVGTANPPVPVGSHRTTINKSPHLDSNSNKLIGSSSDGSHTQNSAQHYGLQQNQRGAQNSGANIASGSLAEQSNDRNPSYVLSSQQTYKVSSTTKKHPIDQA